LLDVSLKNEKWIEVLITYGYFSASNIEEEAAKIKDKDGWIKIGDFLKYAVTTDLCKVEFVDRVFHKSDPEEELRNKALRDGASRRGKVIYQLWTNYFFSCPYYLSKLKQKMQIKSLYMLSSHIASFSQMK